MQSSDGPILLHKSISYSWAYHELLAIAPILPNTQHKNIAIHYLLYCTVQFTVLTIL